MLLCRVVMMFSATCCCCCDYIGSRDAPFSTWWICSNRCWCWLATSYIPVDRFWSALLHYLSSSYRQVSVYALILKSYSSKIVYDLPGSMTSDNRFYFKLWSSNRLKRNLIVCTNAYWYVMISFSPETLVFFFFSLSSNNRVLAWMSEFRSICAFTFLPVPTYLFSIVVVVVIVVVHYYGRSTLTMAWWWWCWGPVVVRVLRSSS